MIAGIVDSGSAPALERVMQFASARHHLIVNNIANLSTPGFRPEDVSVEAFQQTLREAVLERRHQSSLEGSATLAPRDTPEIAFGDDQVHLRPSPIGENILFHDGNDRDLERIMQDMVENFMVFRQAAQLWRSRMNTIDLAIRERV